MKHSKPPSNPALPPEGDEAPGHPAGSDAEEPPPTPDDEWLRAEYQAFNDRWQNGVVQRRGGLAFFTGVQGAILTVVGNQLGNLDTQGYSLALFGIIVCLVAWNNERRIWAYMEGYRERAISIEKKSGLSLITNGKLRSEARFTFSNRKVFQMYYFVMLSGWLAILLSNILSF